MANGNAVRLTFAPEPPAAPASDKPIETAIGEAVASAVFVFYQAILDQQESGILAATTKNAGADRIARISLLMLDHAGGDDDFFVEHTNMASASCAVSSTIPTCSSNTARSR